MLALGFDKKALLVNSQASNHSMLNYNTLLYLQQYFNISLDYNKEFFYLKYTVYFFFTQNLY